MIPSRPFYVISFAIMLFTKAVVIVYMLSAGDYEFLNWKNSQEYIRARRVSPSNNRSFRCELKRIATC